MQRLVTYTRYVFIAITVTMTPPAINSFVAAIKSTGQPGIALAWIAVWIGMVGVITTWKPHHKHKGETK